MSSIFLLLAVLLAALAGFAIFSTDANLHKLAAKHSQYARQFSNPLKNAFSNTNYLRWFPGCIAALLIAAAAIIHFLPKRKITSMEAWSGEYGDFYWHQEGDKEYLVPASIQQIVDAAGRVTRAKFQWIATELDNDSETPNFNSPKYPHWLQNRRELEDAKLQLRLAEFGHPINLNDACRSHAVVRAEDRPLVPDPNWPLTISA